MDIKAYAKINISLDVVGKRDDGYHLLEMIMQRIDLYDEINLNRKDSGISIKCNVPYVPLDRRNLAYKAAELFMDAYDIKDGVEINIYKNIPVAAGLAGGSSNAAAVMLGLKDLYNVEASIDDIRKLGLKIGADVPYCVGGETALCKGIGEVLTHLKPFKNHIVVLVKPPFGVSTKEVYSSLDVSKIYKHPDTQAIIKAIEKDDLTAVSYLMKNVLENVTLKKHRVLKEIKNDMMELGAAGAMMSGSGPTVFGLFYDSVNAQKCYEAMKLKFKEVFITRTI
ncbi:4-(cytidine 5'-diphospho)-2-C-methyl-D-erythritol kinase [Clostridium sp. 19966]|uniref:4-(cytidine 5'-diphospho)-2-C-methyl-D-erythritol kinase n=1 Tax=Clostridium sp. 19966 TaxID=2768166 RepID=UPI0028DEAA03|nr:4-(cytidine 5'-diphospho)-2-C-methyl-D-erythritol kinase [Clostridium sp. 19966]MDT8715615.1 4-(cytidine 5'-diphospho)-2-C-methyl-D-erythritol kinase [Clostridium sp. 19966]